MDHFDDPEMMWAIVAALCALGAAVLVYALVVA